MHGRDPGNRVAIRMAKAITLNTKDAGGGESVMGGSQAKHSKRERGSYADLNPYLLPGEEFLKFRAILLSLPQRGRHTYK